MHTVEEAVRASPACAPQSDSYSWVCDVNPQHPATNLDVVIHMAVIDLDTTQMRSKDTHAPRVRVGGLGCAEMVSPLVSFLK